MTLHVGVGGDRSIVVLHSVSRMRFKSGAGVGSTCVGRPNRTTFPDRVRLARAADSESRSTRPVPETSPG